ncbi:DUF2975 domain-containing protein [Gordonia sp. MP11Mi]|uniref:DUF2975 domain-containing protein n=1 Tax=Gordonia sp. MP11Mi TaxID=3022769 RepID=A0AA97GW38_9ACTN
MNRGLTTFLQVVVVALGAGALALMVWEPYLEGRNEHATLTQIYFNDPFLVCVYVASIPVFVAVYRAAKVIGHAGHNEMFSPAAINELRMIRYCAIAVIGFVGVSELYLFFGFTSDDRAGGVFIGMFIALISTVVAASAAMFERVLQNGVDLKTENDLTV